MKHSGTTFIKYAFYYAIIASLIDIATINVNGLTGSQIMNIYIVKMSMGFSLGVTNGISLLLGGVITEWIYVKIKNKKNG